MAISLWCVLVAALLPVLTTGLAKVGAAYDNARPRESSANLSGWRARAHAAHLNAFEAFPLFAAAVLIAVTQGAPQATVDTLAVGWVIARLAYLGCYLADQATLRSAVWTVAFFLAIAIMTAPAWA